MAVALNAKKETAYGFADLMRAVQYARDRVGGEAVHIGNLDPNVGLPRIRRYAANILRDLEQAGVRGEHVDRRPGRVSRWPGRRPPGRSRPGSTCG